MRENFFAAILDSYVFEVDRFEIIVLLGKLDPRLRFFISLSINHASVYCLLEDSFFAFYAKRLVC